MHNKSIEPLQSDVQWYFKMPDCSLWFGFPTKLPLICDNLVSWISISKLGDNPFFFCNSKEGVRAIYVQDQLSHWSAELKVHRLHAFPWLHCIDDDQPLGFFAVKKICIYIYRWKWQKAKVIYKSFCLIKAFSQPSISPVWTEE